MDARVPIDVVMDAFGVPAVVTRPAPDDTPITTAADGSPLKVAWINATTDSVPAGLDLQRAEHMKLMAISLLDVPTMPNRTVIVAPEFEGGPDKTWQVDSEIFRQFDEVRVLVLEVEG